MAILRYYWSLVTLRAGPEQLPASAFLVRLTIVLHLLTGYLGLLGDWPAAKAASMAVVSTFIMLLAVQLLLWVYNRPERAMQTMAAQAGAEVMIGLIALPFSWAFTTGDSVTPAMVLLLYGLLAWQLVVTARIYARALGVDGLVAGLLAVCYLLASLMAFDLLQRGS